MNKSSSKYSSFTKEQLISKIEKLERERYGLVWDDKEEDVAKQCDIELPVLKEDVSREIVKDTTKPYNFIIEGDNYHSLYTLNFTHKKKIDVIYIDPPYNTGKKNEWKYNDHWIDENDSYRHSKWLSFMNKRLRLAKNLLKNDGVIFISIDDYEQAPLKMLCDKVFGRNNFVAIVPRKTGAGSAATNSPSELRKLNDYVLVYKKSNQTIFKRKIIGEKEYDFEDEHGKFMLEQFQASGSDATRKARPNMWYPIYLTKDGHLTTTKPKKFEKELLPNEVNGEDGRWLWKKETFENDNKKYIFFDGEKISRKVYFDETKDQTIYQVEKAWIDEVRFQNSKGTTELKDIFGKKGIFNNPKPVDLISFLINLHPNQSGTVLDFFAGSGTTGHAVLELNKEDGGNRQFILCTNNENNICEEVTYSRIKNVIEGYEIEGKQNDVLFEKKISLSDLKRSNILLSQIENIENANRQKYDNINTKIEKGILKIVGEKHGHVKGIFANVKYFKQTFVPNVENDKDKRELVNRSTELLCMAENTFKSIAKRSSKNEFAVFKNATKQTAIVYDEDSIEKCVNKLNLIKSSLETVIYVFSYDHTYDEEDFKNLKIDFSVKPIPEAILNIYRKIAKMRKK